MSFLNNVPEYLQAISVYPTGSKYICNPPVLNTDEDYLVLVTDFNAVYQKLMSWDSPWEDCMPPGSDEFASAYEDEKAYGIPWNAFRLGEVNIMVTQDKDWYFASVAATELCKAWNVLDKDKRIRIFRNLKYREVLVEGDFPNGTA